MFTVASLIEAYYYIWSGAVVSDYIVDVSEQQMVSCVNPRDSSYNGYGCGGGWIDNSLNYASVNAGVVKNSLWSYISQTGVCDKSKYQDDSSGNVARFTGRASRVSGYSANYLKDALLTGPVGVNFMVSSQWYAYRGGIISPTDCTDTINHAMALVGWGVDAATGVEYWLLKNSWGTGWGEGGYARLAITNARNGPCGMYQWSYNSVPSFKSVPFSLPAV